MNPTLSLPVTGTATKLNQSQENLCLGKSASAGRSSGRGRNRHNTAMVEPMMAFQTTDTAQGTRTR